jgi:hypothetical protein
MEVKMTGRQRFFSGILGALMPICAILLTLDLTSIFAEESGLSKGHLIGVTIQFIIFLFVGGTVAYMHSDEVKAYKLFQIGMATPALLASFTTSNGLNSAMSTPVEIASPASVEIINETENHSFNFSLIPSAHASDKVNPLDSVESQQIAMEGGSIIQQIFQGVTGSAYGTVKNNRKKEKKKSTVKKPIKKIEIKKESKAINNIRAVAAPLAKAPAAAPVAAATFVSAAANDDADLSSTPRIPSTLGKEMREIRTNTPLSEELDDEEDKEKRYEQLRKKLQDLENMQRQIQDEIRQLRPNN